MSAVSKIARGSFRLLSPVRIFGAIFELIGSLFKYRNLTFEMAKRELVDPHAGQMIGALWALIHPLALMAVYIFLFAGVFKVKLEQNFEMPRDYAAYLLSGLVPWLAFQQILTRSCSSFTGNANLVKQVVFPLEVLPTKSTIAGVIPLLVSLAVYLIYIAASGQAFPQTLVWLPLLVLLLFICGLGFAFILSVACAAYRDTREFVTLFTLMSVYLLPIVYLPGWVPEAFRGLVWANPFSYLVWSFQDVLYFGRFDHPYAMTVFSVMSFLIFSLGYRMYRRVKTQLGSML